MTLPKHPLLRALLVAWGALFLLGTLFVGLVLGAVLLLGAWVFGKGVGRRGVPAFAFGRQAGLFSGLFRPAPPRSPAARGDVIEGEAREVTRQR